MTIPRWLCILGLLALARLLSDIAALWLELALETLVSPSAVGWPVAIVAGGVWLCVRAARG